jgi:hypothetical protein
MKGELVVRVDVDRLAFRFDGQQNKHVQKESQSGY